MRPEIQSEAEYRRLYAESEQNPDAFWARVAHTFYWHQPWHTVAQGGFEHVDYQWFVGGRTNICYNCLDRHLPHRAHHPAIVFEANAPDAPPRTLTYQQLYDDTCRLANALLGLGIGPGHRVCVYMPNVPEAAMALLACVRIGAIHSVVFGGFSAQALADRLNDSQCSLLITADSAIRGTKEIPLKAIADEALANAPSVRHVLVLRRTGANVAMADGRDLWWHLTVPHQPPHCPALPLDAEHPSFILYTSGSTGRPKGIVHSTGGYMVWVGFTFRNVFQTHPDHDVFWCTADVGWITGHSYLIYGPLLNGCTTVMFDGVPTWPSPSRFWDVVARHRVTVLYTAPTAIRALEALGTQWVQGAHLGSLRLLGSVGEPINQEAWEWYHRWVGQGRCPVVDTWWQTETGGVLISGFGGLTPQRPTFATLPMPGIFPALLDDQGHELPLSPTQPTTGNLCIRRPWPGLARTTWADPQRFRNTYFTTYPGYYFTGDGALHAPEGLWRITGRVDDVINVSGHRIGTAEVEDVLNQHPQIVESAVVGFPHPIKGTALAAFAIPEGNAQAHPATLAAEAKALVAERIGPFARPDYVLLVPGLPKTRSGKIMRRILRKLAEDTPPEALGDTTTLLDPSIVAHIAQAWAQRD